MKHQPEQLVLDPFNEQVSQSGDLYSDRNTSNNEKR